MFPAACIHGRFQVLHRDHVGYFQRAAEKYGQLYIGLTGQRRDLHGSALREVADQNPLSYWERAEMWVRFLEAIGQADRHLIGPFPIESPDTLSDFVPLSCVCATTVCEAWNEEKINRLRELGYQVDVLYTNTNKTLSGTMLRNLIMAGSSAWKDYVPESVANFVSEVGLEKRIRKQQPH
jgi:nicotinamide-nucleotide adenylyltransferase